MEEKTHPPPAGLAQPCIPARNHVLDVSSFIVQACPHLGIRIPLDDHAQGGPWRLEIGPRIGLWIASRGRAEVQVHGQWKTLDQAREFVDRMNVSESLEPGRPFEFSPLSPLMTKGFWPHGGSSFTSLGW